MGSWHRTPWRPSLDWTSGGGRLLRQALAVLDRGQPFSVTVFGSCPLQMGVEASLASNDVDIIGGDEFTRALRDARLLKGQADPYVEVCDAATFRPASDWRDRACEVREGRATVVFPHPVDILVSKVPRLAVKDIAAFEAVRRRLGHPTEQEMLESLHSAVDLYRPGFDEEAPQDAAANTRVLWRRIYGREIDVLNEIIRPGLQRRAAAWGSSEETRKAAKWLGEIATLGELNQGSGPPGEPGASCHPGR